MSGFNGSGVFERVHNWVTDLGNSTAITASRFDAENDAFATGLSTCIARNGESTISANIPFNDKKITGLAAGSSSGDSVRYEQTIAALTKTDGNIIVGDGSAWVVESGAKALASLGAMPLAGGTFTGIVHNTYASATDAFHFRNSATGDDLYVRVGTSGVDFYSEIGATGTLYIRFGSEQAFVNSILENLPDQGNVTVSGLAAGLRIVTKSTGGNWGYRTTL